MNLIKLMKKKQITENEAESVKIILMDSLEARDKWLSGSEKEVELELSKSIVVYSGDDSPFTHDEMGSRLMKYLVYVKKVEGPSLASSIFTSVAVRVVSLLHRKDSDSSPRTTITGEFGSKLKSPSLLESPISTFVEDQSPRPNGQDIELGRLPDVSLSIPESKGVEVVRSGQGDGYVELDTED